MTETPPPPAASEDLKAWLAAAGRALGFDAVGVTRPDAVADAGARLTAWVAAGMHGEMSWMSERLAWRADPHALWPEARSVVMLTANYAPDADPLASLARRDRGAISVYATRRDYHDVLKKRLKRLARALIAAAETTGLEPPGVKVFVDTAPVMEKPLAEAAGLGWRGKHTNLVSRDAGSWTFLGALFTTLPLAPDTPHTDRCGACRRCLDVCPTAAFPAPYQLDARRCVSYLTIELKGPIPPSMRAPLGNRIYGCDDCLAVCPWNKFARSAHDAALAARVDLRDPPLAALAVLDEAGFRARFAGTPIKRIGRARFLRNVAIAIGNSGDPGLAPTARSLLDDPAPLIRGAAIWALGRLDPAALRAEAAARRDAEEDADVRAEWTAELGAL